MLNERLVKEEQDELDQYRADLLRDQPDFDPAEVEALCRDYRSWLLVRRDDRLAE